MFYKSLISVLCVFFICSFTMNTSLYAQDEDLEEDVLSESTENEAPDPTMTKFKDIVITSSYGAFVGAITGLAFLAFVSDPGSKLNYIAIGASVGLYAGTLLGIYLGFGVSLPEPEDPTLENFDFEDDFGYIKNNNFNDYEFVASKEYISPKDLKLQMPILVYNF